MFILYPLPLRFGISQLTTAEYVYVLFSYHVKVPVDAYCRDIDGMESLASIILQKPVFMYMETLK
jgi:hypothetical protein